MPGVESALWCGRPQVRIQGGTPIFGLLPFRGDSLETKKSHVGVRVKGLVICDEKTYYQLLKQYFGSDQIIKERKVGTLSRNLQGIAHDHVFLSLLPSIV